MWIGVADAQSGAGIDYAVFNFNYQNHGGGWYYVNVGAYQIVTASASGYYSGSVNTNGYESFRMYLTRSGGGGGGKK